MERVYDEQARFRFGDPEVERFERDFGIEVGFAAGGVEGDRGSVFVHRHSGNEEGAFEFVFFVRAPEDGRMSGGAVCEGLAGGNGEGDGVREAGLSGLGGAAEDDEVADGEEAFDEPPGAKDLAGVFWGGEGEVGAEVVFVGLSEAEVVFFLVLGLFAEDEGEGVFGHVSVGTWGGWLSR